MPPPPSPPPPEMVVKSRYLGFLIWQSISSTAMFLFFKTLLLSTLPSSPSSSSAFSAQSLFVSILSFLAFHLSQLLISISISSVSSPQPVSPASLLQVVNALLRLLFVSGDSFSSTDLRRRAKVSLNLAAFVVASVLSGVLSSLSLFGRVGSGELPAIARVGFRGLLVGMLYAFTFIYSRRWVLHFPIIQRPPFFSFKMGIPLATKRALRLSTTAYVLSSALVMFLPAGSGSTMTQFLLDQIAIYMGIFCMVLCWQTSQHLYQVLHTKRFIFAPPKGSAAAETNPTEPLIAALEETASDSLPRYLAYLDLCMVCENNVDIWRRAAFFEETGETYRKVTAVSLKPLEELASKLCEGLEGSSADMEYQLSKQLQSASDPQLPSRSYEPLNNFQVNGGEKISWCARAVSSLTAHSHEEDRYGVAQLSGSSAATVSTLLSCLLAVEAFMGKKTHLQSPNQMLGPAGIRWAPPNTGKRDVPITKRRAGPLHSKAYAIADVLRTSIYCIVSTFHKEMAGSAKAGLLEKDWITDTKPLYGTKELLVQKLNLFLDYRAS
ncbi:hypothetical protein LINGRAHAP2_LOCUS20448 [Linum grandiflorum]